MYIRNKNASNYFNNLFLSFLFMILIVLGGTNNSTGSVSKVGFLAIGVVLVIGFFAFIIHLIKNQYILKSEKWIYLSSFLFILSYMIGLFIDFGTAALYTFIQVAIIVLFFWGVTFIDFSKVTYKVGYFIIAIFFLFHFIWWVSIGLQVPFQGIMANPNPFGLFIALLLGVFLLFNQQFENKNKYVFVIILLIGMVLLYISESRSSYLLMLISLITYIVWPLVTKKRIIYNVFFLLVTALIFIFTFIYPKLYMHPLGSMLNHYSLLYTGKSFYSGRQDIWSMIIELIEKKPLLGYGASAVPSQFFNTGLSSHNFYLQTTLQVGLLGIVILFIFILSIWNYFYIAKKNNSVRIVASLLIGILFYLLFEVSFTQNNLSAAILQWLIIGLGIHFVRKKFTKESF